ncbi:hypothetical protein WJX73_009720 [Symbiochloris irregularis]|uniref:Bromo domain-containing protein n=1 Tax=Symbiochloris irregularis TaxID=706552 RepID=A0AAW1P3G2_9CHLO
MESAPRLETVKTAPLLAIAPQTRAEQRWELKRKHACISADLELLSFEVAKARQKVAISPACVQKPLTEAETQSLAANRAARLRDITCKHCPPILKVVRAHKWAWPFNQPVDLNRFKDYLRVITQPMDLATVQGKLDAGQYSEPTQFEADMRLIFDNCRRYNAVDQEVVVMGNTLESKFEEKWSAVLPAKVVDVEVAVQTDEAEIRQFHLLAAHGEAQRELARHFERLTPRFGALQREITDAKTMAGKMCPPLSADAQVALGGDLHLLSQQSDEHFMRGMETIVWARDDSLEKSPQSEEYNLVLHNVDGPMNASLQSFANACLRPRSGAQGQHWPGLVVGAGLKGIPARPGAAADATRAFMGGEGAQGDTPAQGAGAGKSCSLPEAGSAGAGSGSGGAMPPPSGPGRTLLRTTTGANLWPPPRPPLLPQQRSLVFTPPGIAAGRMLLEQGSGVGHSDWAHGIAQTPEAAGSGTIAAGALPLTPLPHQGSSVIVLQPVTAAAAQRLETPGSGTPAEAVAVEAALPHQTRGTANALHTPEAQATHSIATAPHPD